MIEKLSLTLGLSRNPGTVRRVFVGLAPLILLVGMSGCTASASASAGPVSSDCSPDSNVDCASGTSGYSCPSGAAAPDADDSTLLCSVPIAANGVDEYCCYMNTLTAPSGSTCEQDLSVGGCQADSAGNPSYGFSCTGSESPDTDFSNITCSPGTPGSDAQGNTATLFCCTYQ